MNTLIKGTFPVRFRRDGKDGVNVWLKYASVLDLTDSGTGKRYPSNNYIFDEPTAECKYIGIGKGVGDEPTQGQYYDWKKYIGDDGTSFTAKGQAISHYTTLTAYNNASKSAGLYLVDNTGGALLKYWNGSASESRSVTDGDAYTTADKHLWVKDGAKWNDLGEIQGPKGDPAYIDTVYLKGASYNAAGIPYAKVTITKNNTSRTYEASARGLHAYKIDRTTLSVTKIGGYDTYIDTATANTLATEINKLDTTVFLAIVSHDACGFTSNFVTAIKQFGGNDIADLTAKRQAFCFLGYKGMAQGTALQVLNVGDAKIAEISSIVSNGVCQGSGQGGNSILSVTNYYLAHSSSSTAPTGTWVTDPSNSGFSASKPYLWNYEVTTFSLSSSKPTTPRVIGVWSKDGKGIKSITEYYLATSASSGVTKDRAKWDWTTTLQTITPTKKYLWNYEVITYTDNSITESDPYIIGVYGDKGDPGKDAVSYKLSSSISAIPLDNDAYPTVSSFTLTAYKFVGNASATFDDSYQLVAVISYSGSTTPITVNTKLSTSGSKMTVYLRTGGLSSGSLLKDIKSVTCYLYHGSTTLDSFAILPIKAGAAGVSYFPNMRGLWQPNANPPYRWKDGSRDMVVYNKGDGTAYLFAVKTAGATNITSCPMTEAGAVNTNDWVQADAPFNMLFGNFVYTDNASVGGFVFSEEQMRSTSTTDGNSPNTTGSNCNILLNGKSGEFVANHATIRGEVNATSGTFKNVKITNNCWIEPETQDGDGWFMRGGNDRIAAWWLGYSGKMTGQFTMNTVYNDGSNHPPTASLTFMTPNIQQGVKPDGLIRAYSNINTPLANFSHANGVMVRICPSEGVGMTFIDNKGNANPIAFNGKGHGALNGVIQGYKLNVMSSGQIDISNGNTVYCNGNGTNLILPTRENCSNVLGTTGAFALDLTIIGASKARDFRVYGKYHNSTTDCYLLNNDHGDNWFATMSQGDVLSLKLIYTGTSFYAYIVNMQN